MDANSSIQGRSSKMGGGAVIYGFTVRITGIWGDNLQRGDGCFCRYFSSCDLFPMSCHVGLGLGGVEPLSCGYSTLAQCWVITHP